MAYSPEMVALLQQLRSRIFAEFGIKIRLVDPQLLSTLGELGKRSRDPFTRKTVVKIMDLGGIDYEIDAQEGNKASASEPESSPDQHYSAMTYRGTRVQRSQSTIPEAAASEPAPKLTKQVYRGRVVYK